MVNILISEINILNKLASIKPNANKSCMKESKNAIRNLQKLYGYALLSYGLKQLYDFDEGRIEIIYSKNGKPYMKNQLHLYFNISHSNEYVVCAISDCEIGIDIQYIMNWSDEKIINIVDKSFSENEFIMMIKSEAKRDLFFNLWVLKESYIKYGGEGLKLPIDYIEFDIIINDISFTDKRDISISPYFKIININSEYKMAICVTEKSDLFLKKVDPIELQIYYDSN